ncbi:DUF962 domain-containing protein [Burkholderia vietnamiensis]|uniref:DUF962 domain-containing protein n=1 Tax=Burkholderia vietnamiensis TaxID=60552 RepID=UPI0031FC9C5E
MARSASSIPYLSEHTNRTSRHLYFVGSSIALVLLACAIASHIWWLLLVGLPEAYAFAWDDHFYFEKNRPATFHYPWKSFAGDWRMRWEI